MYGWLGAQAETHTRYIYTKFQLVLKFWAVKHLCVNVESQYWYLGSSKVLELSDLIGGLEVTISGVTSALLLVVSAMLFNIRAL